MKKAFFIATCIICFVSCPVFAATHTNEMCHASFSANEQPQSTEWECIGKIAAYYSGSTSSKKIVSLYITKTGEAMYKIKVDSKDYIVAHNPLYDPNSNSGKERFKYVAGSYYLNLGPKSIQVQSTEWECIGKIAAYYSGSTYSKKIVSLYITKTGEAMYKIRVDSKDYIVAHNPLYDPNSDSGKERFKYVAGSYYLNLGANK